MAAKLLSPIGGQPWTLEHSSDGVHSLPCENTGLRNHKNTSSQLPQTDIIIAPKNRLHSTIKVPHYVALSAQCHHNQGCNHCGSTQTHTHTHTHTHTQEKQAHSRILYTDLLSTLLHSSQNVSNKKNTFSELKTRHRAIVFCLCGDIACVWDSG